MNDTNPCSSTIFKIFQRNHLPWCFLILISFLLISPSSFAITYGVNDCQDNATNSGCLHPNTVSISGFKIDPATNVMVASGRCTGSLLRVTDNALYILTAGHCASLYLSGLADGSLVNLGVSFDALINKLPGSQTSWDASQYILGGSPLLYKLYGATSNSFNVQWDYGLIVFPLANKKAITYGGNRIDLKSLSPIQIAPLGLLNSFVNNVTTFTNVGYGTGEVFNDQGQASSGSPSTVNYSNFGVRQVSSNNVFTGFSGQNSNLMKGSQNPAQGYNGSCGGDSGGPQFYTVKGKEYQISVTSSGDNVCRSTSINARLDIKEAQDFINQCVMNINSPSEMLNCSLGCTQLDAHGTCPAN